MAAMWGREEGGGWLVGGRLGRKKRWDGSKLTRRRRRRPLETPERGEKEKEENARSDGITWARRMGFAILSLRHFFLAFLQSWHHQTKLTSQRFINLLNDILWKEWERSIISLLLLHRKIQGRLISSSPAFILAFFQFCCVAFCPGVNFGPTNIVVRGEMGGFRKI